MCVGGGTEPGRGEAPLWEAATDLSALFIYLWACFVFFLGGGSWASTEQALVSDARTHTHTQPPAIVSFFFDLINALGWHQIVQL